MDYSKLNKTELDAVSGQIDYGKALKSINKALATKPPRKQANTLKKERALILNSDPKNKYNKEYQNYQAVKSIRKDKNPDQYLRRVSIYAKKYCKDVSSFTSADANYTSGHTKEKYHQIQEDAYNLDTNAEKGGVMMLPEIEKYQELIDSNLGALPYDASSTSIISGWIMKDVGHSENSIVKARKFDKQLGKYKNDQIKANAKAHPKQQKVDVLVNNADSLRKDVKRLPTTHNTRAVQQDLTTLDNNANKRKLPTASEIHKVHGLLNRAIFQKPQDQGMNTMLSSWIQQDVHTGIDQQYKQSLKNPNKQIQKGLKGGIAKSSDTLKSNPSNKLGRKFHLTGNHQQSKPSSNLSVNQKRMIMAKRNQHKPKF